MKHLSRITVLLFNYYLLSAVNVDNDVPRSILTSNWVKISGQLVQVSVGISGVWGVDSNQKIYRLNDDGQSWTKIAGELVHVSCGAEVWGVTKADEIFKYDGGSKPWINIPGRLLTNVDVSNNGHVWGIDRDQSIWRYIGNNIWQKISGKAIQVSVGESGVWIVNQANDIFYRTGTFSDPDSAGTKWNQVKGKLKWIGSGQNILVGTNHDDRIFYRAGITSDAPTGTQWVSVAGRLNTIDVEGLIAVGTTLGHQIYRTNVIRGVNLLSPELEVSQNSIGWDGAPGRAIDGRTDGNYWKGSCTHSKEENGNFWNVKFAQTSKVETVVIWNRVDCCADRINNVRVYVGAVLCDEIKYEANKIAYNYVSCDGAVGKDLTVVQDCNYLTLCEVQVFGKTTDEVPTSVHEPDSGIWKYGICTNTVVNADCELKILGCWGDAWDRAIKGDPRLVSTDLYHCKQYAIDLGYKVFGIEYDYECFTSRDANLTYTKHGRSNKCAVTGRGGPWAINIYEIINCEDQLARSAEAWKASDKASETATNTTAGCESELKDLGCWIDDGNPYRVISGGIRLRSNVINDCKQHAIERGYKVFGIEYETECYTSDDAHITYKKHGRSNRCTETGRGGIWAISAYQIGTCENIIPEPKPNPDDCQTTSLVELKAGSRTFLKERCQHNDKDWFKCPFSDDYYLVLESYSANSDCSTIRFNQVCGDDSHFYQACGHSGCNELTKTGGTELFCSTYICDNSRLNEASAGKVFLMKSNKVCNGVNDCSNTDLDETLMCGTDMYICILPKLRIPSSKVCDLQCDCYYCEDESHCNNMTYGVSCTERVFGDFYFPSEKICNNWANCLEGEDEINCDDEHLVRRCIKEYGYPHIQWRNVYPNQVCAAQDPLSLICRDGMDQVNCTDKERVKMYCLLDGFNTSISALALCKGYSLCDDGYHNLCIGAERGKPIHKSQLCDGISDVEGFDERSEICKNTFEMQCVRRFITNHTNRSSLPILSDWVMDGHRDCENGEDEDEENWKKCGSGQFTRYIAKYDSCEDVFICPGNANGYVKFDELCDKVETCLGENEICTVSRDSKTITNSLVKMDDNSKSFSYCIPGLEYLQHHGANCTGSTLRRPDEFSFRTTHTKILYPDKAIDCRFAYGEMYVYMACLDLCLHGDKCPLMNHISHDSCPNKVDSRFHAVTTTNRLSVLLKSRGDYHNEFYSCRNDKCIDLSKVCDLKNDCGDGSDEVNCTNHFTCDNKYIPLTSVCDGKMDCDDYSDECGSLCGDNGIIDSLSLLIICCVVGVLAVSLNIFNLIETVVTWSKVNTLGVMMNRLMIILISLGDLLMGFYLVLIAAAHIYYGKEYCSQQFLWLSSTKCAILGLLSTIGSQLSLLAMTSLSIFRICSIRQMVQPSMLSRKSKVIVSVSVTLTILLSVAVGVIPLFPQLEDYFVNGLYYHGNPIFTGSVNKATHGKLLGSYYGMGNFPEDFSWNSYRDFVGRIFTADYSGVHGQRVHFYGSTGVCLFKLLVTPDDPQKEFSTMVLSANFCCFMLISVCYIVIVLESKRSSNNANTSNERGLSKLELKIIAIILTDFFCWIPLTVVCFLHFGEVVDATPWYPIFSTILLPLNSVINPILYNRNVEKIILSPFSAARNLGHSIYTSQRHDDITMVTQTTKSVVEEKTE